MMIATLNNHTPIRILNIHLPALIAGNHNALWVFVSTETDAPDDLT